MTLVLNRKIGTSGCKNSSKGNLMNDFSCQKIILCIHKEAKTVKQISTETGLSISTTYRKINQLNKNNLLILSGDINSENKREFKYKSKTSMIFKEFFTQIKSNGIF